MQVNSNFEKMTRKGRFDDEQPHRKNKHQSHHKQGKPNRDQQREVNARKFETVH